MSPFCRRFLLCVLSLSLIAFSIIVNQQGRAAAPEGIEVFADNPQNSVVAGFDFSSLDRSASACQDFNRFANGGWMDKNPIPAAYSRWGRFELLDDQNQNVLHGILDGLVAKKKFANMNEQKIADFYGSCMDEKNIEAEGIKPLEPELERIAQISDLVSLEDEIARLHARHGAQPRQLGKLPLQACSNPQASASCAGPHPHGSRQCVLSGQPFSQRGGASTSPQARSLRLTPHSGCSVVDYLARPQIHRTRRP